MYVGLSAAALPANLYKRFAVIRDARRFLFFVQDLLHV